MVMQSEDLEHMLSSWLAWNLMIAKLHWISDENVSIIRIVCDGRVCCLNCSSDPTPSCTSKWCRVQLQSCSSLTWHSALLNVPYTYVCIYTIYKDVSRIYKIGFPQVEESFIGSRSWWLSAQWPGQAGLKLIRTCKTYSNNGHK